jgi:hypothetical protein
MNNIRVQNFCPSRSQRSSLSTETVGIVLEIRFVSRLATDSDSSEPEASRHGPGRLNSRLVHLIFTQLAMKYIALLSGGKDSCYNLLHCHRNGHELVAAASLRPEPGKGA